MNTSLSPQFCWQVLPGPHQIKSGGYTRLLTPMHFVAQQGEDRWPCTWPVLYMWPPCQWSEISFSVPQCSFLLLKSVSSAHVVFTWQLTDFMVCPAGQFYFFHLLKMPPAGKHGFHQTLRRSPILCRGGLSYVSPVSDFCHISPGQQETLLTFCRGADQWDPQNYRGAGP